MLERVPDYAGHLPRRAMAMLLRPLSSRSMVINQILTKSTVATRCFSEIAITSDQSLATELNDNTVPTLDLVAELNAKHPEKNIRWAGANTWRTLEWMLPHPPPFHTFEEQPIIKETVGAAAVMPRPPNYAPESTDPYEHSYHPGTHQTL